MSNFGDNNEGLTAWAEGIRDVVDVFGMSDNMKEFHNTHNKMLEQLVEADRINRLTNQYVELIELEKNIKTDISALKLELLNEYKKLELDNYATATHKVSVRKTIKREIDLDAVKSQLESINKLDVFTKLDVSVSKLDKACKDKQISKDEHAKLMECVDEVGVEETLVVTKQKEGE